jgi:DNA-binding response OmpR family regulator
MSASHSFPLPDPSHVLAGLAPSPFLLGRDCWYEPALASIITPEAEIPLTRRENALLMFLLKAPYQWHQAADLAAQLAARCRAKEVSLQWVRQSMMGLRAKLRKLPVSPDLLQRRHGHGYGIFPPQPPPDSSP